MTLQSPIRSSSAFTLVELMTSMVVLGVLAAVAAPAYKDYVTSVKIAEAYVVIDAIQKKQATSFAETGYFIPTVSYASNAAATVTKGGSKQAISFYSGFDSVTPEQPQYETIQAYFKPMQNVVPDGTASYFQFKSNTGSFTSSGDVTSIAFNYNSSTGVTSVIQGVSPGVSGVDIRFRISPNDLICQQSLDYSDIGVTERNQNVHYSMVYAGLSQTSDTCLVIFQTMQSISSVITRGPFVTLSLSTIPNPKVR